MKTNSVNLVQGPFMFDYLKTKKSRVFLPQDLGVDIHNKIMQKMSKLEFVSDKLQKPVQFYPKSDELTLMNFGTFTTALKNDDTQENIDKLIDAHVNKVYDLHVI